MSKTTKEETKLITKEIMTLLKYKRDVKGYDLRLFKYSLNGEELPSGPFNGFYLEDKNGITIEYDDWSNEIIIGKMSIIPIIEQIDSTEYLKEVITAI